MAVNDIFCPHLSPIQFVGVNRSQPPQYNTRNRNLFLFREQVSRWFNKEGYCKPHRIGDNITLQFVTHSLDPITYTIYKCSDLSIYSGPFNLDTIPCVYPALPNILWQKYIDTTSWDEGHYFIVISATTGDQWQSEGLDVRVNWPNTNLFEINNSFNTQQTVFVSDVPFIGLSRIYSGYDNNFLQNYIGKEYIDQQQNAYWLNGIPYETGQLFMVGLPDYEIRKILRYLLLDNTKIDGEGFTLNPGAELERVFTKGAPKKIYSIDIRPNLNTFGVVVNGGVPDVDAALMIAVDAQAFGPNQTNASGSADPVLIDITVNP